MKKIFKILVGLLLFYIFIIAGTVWYDFITEWDSYASVEYLNKHAKKKSSNCCALYCMIALNKGGKLCVLLPAFAYKYYLPLIGYSWMKKDKMQEYKPKIGDIAVFPPHLHHIFGHIAIYNGEQWVSDFKQNNIIVSPVYNMKEVTIFRDQYEVHRIEC